MYHIIKDNIYYLYSDEGSELMNIKLTNEPGDQLVITTATEVYAGPVNFITFSGDIKEK